jgi:glycosyltransferase involved in cell wall biosynthesis
VTARFSVIVPTHDRQALLDEALGSLLEQTLGDFECIVVDDAGSIPVRLPRDERFRALRRPIRGGAAAARNTGLAAATGEYVAFLDSDDLYAPQRLELAAAAHSRAPLAICWQTSFGAATGRALRRRLEGVVEDRILEATTPSLGALSIERQLCLYFNESYRACEDLDWWLRQAETTEVTTIPEVAYFVRRHDEPRAAGPAIRAQFSRQLLEQNREYFAAHRKARAFRLRRIAILEHQHGDDRAASSAALASFRSWPGFRALLTLARAASSRARTLFQP